MTEKNMTVFSQKLAGYLMVNGFVLIDISRHCDGSGRNVFYFKNTPEIKESIEIFKTNRL